MRSFGVVQADIALEIFNHILKGVDGSMDEVFVFDDVVSAFHKSIVKTRVSHADLDVSINQFLAVFIASILYPSV